jgi:hypothetical protein
MSLHARPQRETLPPPVFGLTGVFMSTCSARRAAIFSWTSGPLDKKFYWFTGRRGAASSLSTLPESPFDKLEKGSPS